MMAGWTGHYFVLLHRLQYSIARPSALRFVVPASLYSGPNIDCIDNKFPALFQEIT